MNVLVQPTAGDNVIVPMVGRAEAEFGITSIMEAQDGFDRGQKDMRIIVAAHALRTPFFVRKDSAMHTIAAARENHVLHEFDGLTMRARPGTRSSSRRRASAPA